MLGVEDVKRAGGAGGCVMERPWHPLRKEGPLGGIPGSFPVEPPEDILFCVAMESGSLSFSLRHQIDSPLR